MPQTLTDFALQTGLNLTPDQFLKLDGFVDLIWQKKDFLNLTSAADKTEVRLRHMADGFLAVQKMLQLCGGNWKGKTAADAGAGAGYIGFVTAICLPQLPVSLIESLEKRCSFMMWAALKLQLANITIINARIGQKPLGPFDYVTQRAMGQINEILPICAPLVKDGGAFIAYQGENSRADDALVARLGLGLPQVQDYQLPCDSKIRRLATFLKLDTNS